jgi:hypothetical protein
MDASYAVVIDGVQIPARSALRSHVESKYGFPRRK